MQSGKLSEAQTGARPQPFHLPEVPTPTTLSSRAIRLTTSAPLPYPDYLLAVREAIREADALL